MFAIALFVLIVSSSSSLSMCSLVAVFSSLGVTFPVPTQSPALSSSDFPALSAAAESGRGGKGREGEKGQDEGEETAEEGEGLPSSYCTISLNDELVYETRVKPITSSPMFNAGTERLASARERRGAGNSVSEGRSFVPVRAGATAHYL
ncbi:hypothetical protein NUW54_g11270 [Trametes sanguinea]|uniref:Uncharacterized protein n=1 Tax=Trametes sanguinea TaxID=158606 RepID=A0ACC1NIB4_9APHY|nr:hypothetical protein NUW54_g11270 [Trametes sanguinea]